MLLILLSLAFFTDFAVAGASSMSWVGLEWSDAVARSTSGYGSGRAGAYRLSRALPDKVLPAIGSVPLGGAWRPPPPGKAVGSTSLSAGFEALADDLSVVVPDVMGAVGPDHLMVALNTQVRVQTKAGAQLSIASLGAFWGALAAAPFDPKVVYDEGVGRFVFVALDQKRSTASALLLGVSASADPTGAWTLRRFEADPADLEWVDYPNLSLNSRWIAVNANMFSVAGDTLRGSKMWVFDKAAALSPGALTPTIFPTAFDNVGPGGTHSIHGAVTFGSEERLFFVDNGWVSAGARYLRVSQLSGPTAAPVWSLVPGGAFGGGFVLAGPSGAPVAAPQAGSAQTLDAGFVRIANAVFRDGTLWCAHAGGVPAGAPVRNAVFWYELRPDASPPRVVQQGIVEDPGGAMSYFFPSIAVNARRDALLGFAGSSPTTFAGGYFAARSGRDTPGTFQAVQLLKAGEAAHFRTDSAGLNRWGDYTATVVDPSGGLAFWTIQQYAVAPAGVDRWGTWWGRVEVAHDVPSALSSARAFPVPWRPGSGGPHDDAAVPGCGRGLVFEDIAPEARIRIYSLQGDLLRELDVTSSDAGCKAWDGRNRWGREVASGVYLAEIRASSGAKTLKRLAIER